MDATARRISFWLLFGVGYLIIMGFTLPGLWPFIWTLYGAVLIVKDIRAERAAKKLLSDSLRDALDKL